MIKATIERDHSLSLRPFFEPLFHPGPILMGYPVTTIPVPRLQPYLKPAGIRLQYVFVSSFSVHSLFIICPFSVHILPNLCPFSAHPMSILYPFSAHSLLIRSSFSFHSVSIICSFCAVSPYFSSPPLNAD